MIVSALSAGAAAEKAAAIGVITLPTSLLPFSAAGRYMIIAFCHGSSKDCTYRRQPRLRQSRLAIITEASLLVKVVPISSFVVVELAGS